MRLRKPCEHRRYEAHPYPSAFSSDPQYWCPGGEFLADDALVIEREPDGRFPEWITDVDGPVWFQCGGTDDLLEDIFEVVATRLSVREDAE